MKKILGLDLGTASIGWALVNEKENENEHSSIIKLGVRVNPLTVDEMTNFEKGKSITTTADRTLKRGMRRNLQRYKLRRKNLIDALKSYGFITEKTILAEQGNSTTFQTYRLRAKAAEEEISLEELSRVLLMINKKRGYKSNRKADKEEDGQLIDGMSIAKQLYEDDITPGQFVYNLFLTGNKRRPDFYRSDLLREFEEVWCAQKEYYPELLTDNLKSELLGKNKKQTWAICSNPFNLVGIKRTTKGFEQIKENYQWRTDSLTKQLGLEELAIVLQDINGDLYSSSGYLGNISDRSKELFFNHQTVGQYLMSELDKNPNQSLTNQVFYRQDYLDEFEILWETQAKFHTELTPERKKEIRDIVIFYQRPLKSKKGLINFCELESRQVTIVVDGKTKVKKVGPRACPKSSPIFQEFKIWQRLNDIRVSGEILPSKDQDLFGNPVNMTNGERYLTKKEMDTLSEELSIKDKMTKNEALKLLFPRKKDIDLNFDNLEGNRTQAVLYRAYENIIEQTGHDSLDFGKMPSAEVKRVVKEIFGGLGYKTDFLEFDSSLEGVAFEQQPLFRLWHLLYSYEGDNSKTGTEKLIDKIQSICGFDRDYASTLAKVTFQDDYGSLSTKAMRRILPFMKEGIEYSDACVNAGYNHSKRSLTKEQLDKKVYKEKLEQLPKGELRNPVVEKILNQMINVINEIIDTYGKPDEIRIEMARDLKSSAAEREDAIDSINKNTLENEKLKKEIETRFGFKYVSRNDIIRYRLYKELASTNYHTLYSNTRISEGDIFSKNFDIEHIIPQAKLFDDSFSNKTIETKDDNIRKGNMTALDYVAKNYDIEEYRARIEKLHSDKIIGDAKYKKLLMSEADIPSGFIKRDIRDSQYIARKAREILEDIVPTVTPTTGSITARLREDWQLIDIMQELDWNKYDKLGLTEIVRLSDYDGNPYTVRKIKDWTKRNDHRHHAMDALTIAFTKPSFIQYLNNLNARVGRDKLSQGIVAAEKSKICNTVYSIEAKELYRDRNGNLRFVPPMPLNDFRAEAKKQLEATLVSIKAKNKVVTQNTNNTKKSSGTNKKVQLTPRGQLHLETVYGSQKVYVTKNEKIGSSFDAEKISTVAKKNEREALLSRLAEFGNDPKKAFTGKNSPDKNPIFLDSLHTEQIKNPVKTVTLETVYTIRKKIDEKLNVDKVIDPTIKKILTDRLTEYGDDAKIAFSNLKDNPIFLNKDKGICIKTVTIVDNGNALALRTKHDHLGNIILDDNGKAIPDDFVNTGNNHHIAIYIDGEGNLQENVVSFFEATRRATAGEPIIDKDFNKDKEWQFLFTMKQNEYFVFPKYEEGIDESGNHKTIRTFNPKAIDLLNPENNALISPNLYRVQKISSKYYCFRHHLETTIEDNNVLQNTTWKRIRTINLLKGIVKVRINNIGQIVQIGEY